MANEKPTVITPERLRQARELNRLTQDELAERVGVSLALYRSYEAGRAQPDTATLERIGFAANVPIAFFFKPPPPEFPLGSLLWCNGGRVCDPCERATGEEVEAFQVCAACGEDLCPACTHDYEVTATLPLGKEIIVKRLTYCPTCFEQVIGL